jgi:hypothetical protein
MLSFAPDTEADSKIFFLIPLALKGAAMAAKGKAVAAARAGARAAKPAARAANAGKQILKQASNVDSQKKEEKQ